MTVVIVNDFAHVNGGAGQVAIDTAKLLADYGHKVILFAAVGPISEDISNHRNIKVICLNQQDILHDTNRLNAVIQGIYNKKARSTFRNLLAALDTGNTIIHIHTLQKALSTSIIPVANEMGFKVVYHLHDYGVACPNLGFYNYQKQKICHHRAMSSACISCNCDRRSALHKGWRVLRQYTQHKLGLPGKVDAFIAISEFSLNILEPYLGNKPVYLLPNIIDVKKRPRVNVEYNRAFLYVGRLSYEKGATLFAEAAANLRVPAIFVGTGEDENKIKEIYPEADMRGWLSHTEMESVWREGMSLVFPSRLYETQGLTVSEALAHGLPVIVPNNCAAMASIVDGENGKIFENGRVESLIMIMKEMLESGKAERMGRTAYAKYWKKNWDREVYNARLIDIYSQVLEESR